MIYRIRITYDDRCWTRRWDVHTQTNDVINQENEHSKSQREIFSVWNVKFDTNFSFIEHFHLCLIERFDTLDGHARKTQWNHRAKYSQGTFYHDYPKTVIESRQRWQMSNGEWRFLIVTGCRCEGYCASVAYRENRNASHFIRKRWHVEAKRNTNSNKKAILSKSNGFSSQSRWPAPVVCMGFHGLHFVFRTTHSIRNDAALIGFVLKSKPSEVSIGIKPACWFTSLHFSFKLTHNDTCFIWISLCQVMCENVNGGFVSFHFTTVFPFPRCYFLAIFLGFEKKKKKKKKSRANCRLENSWMELLEGCGEVRQKGVEWWLTLRNLLR